MSSHFYSTAASPQQFTRPAKQSRFRSKKLVLFKTRTEGKVEDDDLRRLGVWSEGFVSISEPGVPGFIKMNTHNDPVLTVVFLFLLGLISPGPNFLVVVQATLNWGRLAGFLTGLGAATGDALYATCGLFGVAELIETNRGLMMSIRILGGLYLIWIGIQMLHRRRSSEQYRHRSSHSHNLGLQHFVRGLATDLANPKTVVFFASIFATTLEPDTPHEVRIKMLFGIVLTSIAWRFCLTVVFSNSLFRSIYERREQAIQRAFGLLICLFGAHLLTRSA